MESGMTIYRSKQEFDQQTKDIFSIISPIQKQPQVQQPKQQQQQQKKTVKQKQKVKKIQKFIREYIGRNQPLAYRQQYSFCQNWQNTQKDINTTQSGYYHRSGKIKIVTFILFPTFIIQLWLFSISRIFSYDNCWWIFLWGLIEELVFIGFRIFLFFGQFNHKVELIPQIVNFMSREKYCYLIGCAFSIVYHSAALSGGCEFQCMQNLQFFALDLLVIVYRYSLLSQIYSFIRIQMMGTKYRLKMNLFDLSVNVLTMIHIFVKIYQIQAILLFLCTYYDPMNNWHKSNRIMIEDSWLNKYLESFYFACTTMLTVGFGDISPTNGLQIICILIVQIIGNVSNIIGIANNAYIINEFGVTLTQIYMRRNMLERDIANAEKLVNFNHLQQQIRQKLLNSLINYQPSNDDLDINEQQSLLSKTSEQIKHEIIQNGQRRAVKMSLYLISTFSKKLLEDLSVKLVKAIYPPHNYLPIARGKQRFYIIAKGNVDIIPHRKISNNNSLKNINVTQNSLLNEIYGYGAVFSKKKWGLKAVTRSYVICYCCELQDFVDCAANYQEDYEKYFQICHRIQLFRMPEEYEVPSINSKKEHYVPSIFYLLKKNKSKRFCNQRKYYRRGGRKCFKVHQKFQQDQINSASYAIESADSIQEGQPKQCEGSRRSIMIQRTLSPFTRQISFISKPRNQQTRNIVNRNLNNFRRFKLQQKKNQELQIFPNHEIFKEFKKYFPNGNLSAILPIYNNKIDKLLNKMELDILRPPIKKNRFQQLMTRLRKNSENT